jgi:hypothetical protein
MNWRSPQVLQNPPHVLKHERQFEIAYVIKYIIAYNVCKNGR